MARGRDTQHAGRCVRVIARQAAPGKGGVPASLSAPLPRGRQRPPLLFQRRGARHSFQLLQLQGTAGERGPWEWEKEGPIEGGGAGCRPGAQVHGVGGGRRTGARSRLPTALHGSALWAATPAAATRVKRVGLCGPGLEAHSRSSASQQAPGARATRPAPGKNRAPPWR